MCLISGWDKWVCVCFTGDFLHIPLCRTDLREIHISTPDTCSQLPLTRPRARTHTHNTHTHFSLSVDRQLHFFLTVKHFKESFIALILLILLLSEKTYLLFAVSVVGRVSGKNAAKCRFMLFRLHFRSEKVWCRKQERPERWQEDKAKVWRPGKRREALFNFLTGRRCYCIGETPQPNNSRVLLRFQHRALGGLTWLQCPLLVRPLVGSPRKEMVKTPLLLVYFTSITLQELCNK